MFGKTPGEIEAMPTAADGTPMTAIGADGRPAATIIPEPDTRDSIQLLKSIETLLARLIYIHETYYEIPSSSITVDDIQNGSF